MNNCNMNTNCKAWFYSPDGSYYLGPVDEQKMKTLIQEGTVTRNHLVWNSSMNGWEKIENTVLAIFFGSISGFASASSNAIGDESSIEEENEGGEDFQNQSGPSGDSALIKTAKLINRLEKRSKNENDDYNLVEKFKKHARSLQDQNKDENPETIDNDLAEKFEQIEIYKKQFFSEKNYSNPDSSNNPEIASDIHDDIPEVPDDIPDVPDDIPDVPDDIPDVPDDIPDVPDDIPDVPDDIPEVPDDIPDVPDDIPDESEDTDCDDTISEDDDDGILGNVFDFLSE